MRENERVLEGMKGVGAGEAGGRLPGCSAEGERDVSPCTQIRFSGSKEELADTMRRV